MTKEQQWKFKKVCQCLLKYGLVFYTLHILFVSYQLKQEVLQEIQSIEIFNYPLEELREHFTNNHYQVEEVVNSSSCGFQATKGNMSFEYLEHQSVNSYRFEYTNEEITPLFNGIKWKDRFQTIKNKLHLTFSNLIFAPVGVRVYDDLIDINYDDYLILIGCNDQDELWAINVLVQKEN